MFFSRAYKSFLPFIHHLFNLSALAPASLIFSHILFPFVLTERITSAFQSPHGNCSISFPSPQVWVLLPCCVSNGTSRSRSIRSNFWITALWSEHNLSVYGRLRRRPFSPRSLHQNFYSNSTILETLGATHVFGSPHTLKHLDGFTRPEP